MNEFESMMKALAEGLKVFAQGVEILAEKIGSMSEEIQKRRPPEPKQQETPSTSQPNSGPEPVKASPQKPEKKKRGRPKGSVSKKIKTKKKKITTIVYEHIAKHENGVPLEQLLEETGFDKRRIQNAVYKLKLDNKITSEKRGWYKLVKNSNLQ